MRVFQHRRRDAAGRVHKDKRWTIETRVRDAVVRIPGYLDRAASEELGRLVDTLDGMRGVRPTGAIATRLEALPIVVRERLAKLGLIDLARLAGSRPLTEHVAAFRASLEARGSTAAHVATTCRRVLQVLAGSGATYWSEIRPAAVERFLHKLRTEGAPSPTPTRTGKVRKAKPISAKGSNYALRDVRAFCSWMVASGFAEEHPLRSLRAVPALATYERATLTPDELQRLIAATTASGMERYGAPALERAWIYRLCAEVGARPNREARNLRVADLVLEGSAPAVTLQASHTKATRRDTVPLKLSTARELAAFLGGRVAFPAAAVFPNLPNKYRLADMLREDCAAAGIKLPEDPYFRRDFYGSTRTTFVSNLNAAHVDPATMQTLARHMDVATTLRHYVHAHATDRTRAVEALPDLGAPVTLKRAAGDGVDVRSESEQSGPENPHRPTHRFGCDRVSTLEHASAPGDTPNGTSTHAGVAELADAMDSKSIAPALDSAENPEKSSVSASTADGRTVLRTVLDPELAAVVDAWPTLAPALRAAILAVAGVR